MVDKVMFSSATDEWSTPQEFYDNLNAIHHFNLDPCATRENAKCKHYYTKEDDGLFKPWYIHEDIYTTPVRGRVFVNPPYGRGTIVKWVMKAVEEIGNQNAELVVMLLPVRTDTKWFHQYVYDTADEIYFIKGRLKFGGAENSAPFPSMVVVYSHTEEWL